MPLGHLAGAGKGVADLAINRLKDGLGVLETQAHRPTLLVALRRHRAHLLVWKPRG